jgi:hypothetical protein
MTEPNSFGLFDKDVIMDVEGKWVHFEDTLELEVFLNICEEAGITWPNKREARYYLEVELERYYQEKSDDSFRCGYFVRYSKLYDVNLDHGNLVCNCYDISDEDHFKLC